VLDHDPEPIRKWVPDLPLPVVKLIDKALVKEPDWRFQSAAELREALRGARRAMAASRMAAAALGASDDAETTLLGSDAPTFVNTPDGSSDLRAAATQTRLGSMARERTLVTGATALDLSATVDEPPTARPDPTFVGAEAPPEPPASRVWLYASAVAAVAIVSVAGVVWMRTRPAPAVPPAADLASKQDMLRDIIITGQVELARADLENKEYKGAVEKARQTLAIDPQNADAKDIRDRGQAFLDELEDTSRAAGEAYERGDLQAASEKLSRVLEIDAHYPAATRLIEKLDQHFRQQADGARSAASRARADAEPARRSAPETFAAADRRSREAEALWREDKFAAAAQRFVEAGDLFARARREAVAVAIPPPRPTASTATTMPSVPSTTAPASTVPSNPPSAVPPAPVPTLSANGASNGRVPTPSASVSQPPPTQAPPTAAPIASSATPSLPRPAAGLPGPGAADQAVRQVLADYGRALETHDLALFKSLKPDLSGEEEKRLQESFKAIRSHQVGITVESVQFDGGQATVRVSRHDVVNGKAMKEQQQTFRLVQKGAGWEIVSIGQ
jgi:hypothetical protein